MSLQQEYDELKLHLEMYKDQWKRHWEARKLELELEQQNWFTKHLNDEVDDVRAELEAVTRERDSLLELMRMSADGRERLDPSMDTADKEISAKDLQRLEVLIASEPETKIAVSEASGLVSRLHRVERVLDMTMDDLARRHGWMNDQKSRAERAERERAEALAACAALRLEIASRLESLRNRLELAAVGVLPNADDQLRVASAIRAAPLEP